MKCPKCKADNPDDSRYCNKCGSSLIDIPTTPTEASTETERAPKKSALDFAPGQHFGKRYQIIEEIGRGGMGRVYKAVDKELNKVVALKMIKPELSDTPSMVKRFKKELILAREVTHKNVCRIHDLGEVKGIKFISMRYIDGQDLKQFITQSGILTTKKTLAITKQICQALQAAHNEGVIHRDLKPRNIMLDKEGNAYVMDFGIAKSIEAGEATRAGVVMGTPAYISPEQAEGEKVDHRSDMYSLGAIMYEMLTGTPPFKADSIAGLIHKHIKEAPKLPSTLNPQISEALEEIILKCLEKKPEKRYQNADEIIKAIDEAKPEKIAEARLAKIQKNSIAVLPFADMSPQKDQEYFCDGMTEELINTLTKVEGLQVASRTAAFQFKGKGYNIHEISKELKVQTVLEGSVRKAGNRLRIAAQLINVDDGYHLWSEKYDRDFDDVFSIQDEISLAIVDKLKVKLLGKEKAALTKRYTENLDAYNLYLKGRYFWNKRTPEGLQKGFEHFQQAIEKDPTYALAYAGMADYYNILGYYDYLHPKEVYPKAKAAAEKALQIDDALGEAYESLGYVRMYYEWDWSAAEREFKQALELNPSGATAHLWYASYLGNMGRHDEAIAEIKRAQELDPLSILIIASLGGHFYLARQYDKAIKELKKAQEMDPNFIFALLCLPLAYAEKGMYEEAIAVAQKAIDISGVRPLIANLGYIYSISGKREQVQKVLDELHELTKQQYISAWSMASIYAGLDLKDQALQWLEKAYEERDHWMTLLKVSPSVDRLRSDPRFKALLKKMNLE